jgi:hypothetical protein
MPLKIISLVYLVQLDSGIQGTVIMSGGVATVHGLTIRLTDCDFLELCQKLQARGASSVRWFRHDDAYVPFGMSDILETTQEGFYWTFNLGDPHQ